MTRSAYVQFRCAVVAQVERAVLTLHPLFEGWGVKLDSISPTLSAQDFQLRGGQERRADHRELSCNSTFVVTGHRVSQAKRMMCDFCW